MFVLSFLKTVTISGMLLASSITSSLPNEHVLTQREFSLLDRYPNAWVNEVFADNIVLTLHYLKGDIKAGEAIDWNKEKQPFEVSFSLKPHETFAFQDDILPQFKGKVAKTTHAIFNAQQGFKSSGWLIGDGVCHLASFMHMAAKEAGLEVLAPTRHDFAKIADIPQEYGTSIFYLPGNEVGNAAQNLYITNTLDEEVTFTFKVESDKITLKITE